MKAKEEEKTQEEEIKEKVEYRTVAVQPLRRRGSEALLQARVAGCQVGKVCVACGGAAGQVTESPPGEGASCYAIGCFTFLQAGVQGCSA